MTASVSGPAPSAVDQLLQSVRGRVSAHREGSKQTQDDKSDSQDVAEDYSKPKVAATSDRAVSRTEKSSSRKPTKSDAADSEASFAETIDSIGQQEPKPGSNVERTDNWPQSTLVAAVAGNIPIEQKTPETVPQSAENSQRPIRPASLLSQDSIAALIDAKARLMPSGDGPKAADVATQDVSLPQQELQPDVLSSAMEPTPATVNGQETHWNFNDKTIVAAALQASGLQSEESLAPRGFSSPRVSASVQKPADSPTDPLPRAQVQAVTGPAADTPDNSFLPDKDQTGPHLQQPATTDAASAKASQSESSNSIDRVFSVDPKPAQNAGNVTTQVRNGVLDALAGKAGELAPSTATADLQDRAPSPPPVLRSLDLTLSPPDLGSVRLRMSLKSNSLEIEADASKAATAKILNDDRTSLERGLRDAGYDVASLKITDISSSNAMSSNGQQTNGSPSREGDQARSNFAGQQDGNSQRRDGATSDQAQRRPQDHSQKTAAGDPTNSRAGGAVYI
ncbi:flagellar hook-length control protein FliK [Hyphomicrobium sp. 99]|uniref:flagellar hook-length control protein FliK n=1 Tax=Hyphomicrobium sp. 99 TaxID=1163419 RepID=UPI0005F7D32B|nr:flagellar hook-length control protein FliK [Hyphomicrobium sp. 99]